MGSAAETPTTELFQDNTDGDKQGVDIKWHGSTAVELFYKRADGQPGTQLLFRNDEPNLEIVETRRAWRFNADGNLFRLVAEAYRIHLAHLFDPVLAVHTSLIEALPHQIIGVYGEMLPRQPLRFLLADEAILTTDTDVLTHLAQRFPSLEEGEIDAVVAELRRLLQEAFANAKEANPDKRTIRLTLR